jgi:MFS family permease
MRLPITSGKSLGHGFRSLKNRNYRLFYFGQLVSLAGTWMQDVALSWLVLSLTDSPVALGLTMTIRFGPALLLSAYSGVLADRLPKRTTIMVVQTLQMFIALAMAILVSTEAITVALIYLLTGVRGVVEAVEAPTRQAFVPEMVGPHDLPNAVALNSTLFNAARIAGPAIGAVIISTLGIAACFYVNAVSFLAVIAALAAMRTAELYRTGAKNASTSGSGLREGFRYVRATPDLIVIFVAMGTLATFGFNFQTMLPLITRYVLDAGASTLAMLMTSMGAGSVVAGLVAAYRGKPRQRLLLISGASMSVLLLLVGLSSSLPFTMVLMFLVGVAAVLFLTSCSTRLQLLVPDHLRGRVLGIYMMFFVGTIPLGSYLIGWLAESVGVPATMIILAVLCMIGIAAALAYALRSRPASGGSARTVAAPALAAEGRLRVSRRGEQLDDLRVQE